MQIESKKVYILELPSGTSAMADPGTIEVDRGDTIEFENQTSNDATLFIAEDNVLVDVTPLKGVSLPRSVTSGFPVSSTAADGIHEYQVLVTLRNRRQVYAIGASTPRIIIRSSTND